MEYFILFLIGTNFLFHILRLLKVQMFCQDYSTHSIVMWSRSFISNSTVANCHNNTYGIKKERVKVVFNLISLLIGLHRFSPFRHLFILLLT
jgi:hypothetical protein